MCRGVCVCGWKPFDDIIETVKYQNQNQMKQKNKAKKIE